MIGKFRVSIVDFLSENNNFKEENIINPEFGEYFGFTEKEVVDLVSQI